MYCGALGMEENPYLRPVGDIHLYTYDMIRGGGTGDIRTVYVAFLLAAFILVLACANFINLTTARSISRASEVGMRKVLGGTRAHAMLQFIERICVVNSVRPWIVHRTASGAFARYQRSVQPSTSSWN